MTTTSSRVTIVVTRMFAWPAAVVVVMMMLHITANAIMRALFVAPMRYTLEITEFWYMPVVALLGFAVAQLRNEHLVVDLIDNQVTRRTLAGVIAGASLLCAILFLALGWFGLEEALHAADIEQTAGGTELPSWPVYWLVPVSFWTMSVSCTVVGLRHVRQAASGQTEPEPVVKHEEVL